MHPRRAGLRELVLDTSVAAKLFLDDEELVSRARSAFAAHGIGQLRLIAPFAIYYELPSTFLSAVRQGRITREDATASMEAFFRLELPIVGADLTSIASLDRDAFRVADRLGCSFYDAIFIALAERLGTQVLTAEKKLYERLQDKTNFLLWLDDLEL